jgi:hypothetical protein
MDNFSYVFIIDHFPTELLLPHPFFPVKGSSYDETQLNTNL